MKNNALEKITQNIKEGKAISPFLFTGANIELLGADVQSLALELLQSFEIPSSYTYTLSDNGEKIKIQEIREFFTPSVSKTPYDFQVFIIENISRLTLQSANSLLKLLEEPGKYNIIFLTNTSTAGVLDTILSRVQCVDLGGSQIEGKDEFFYGLIADYLQKNDKGILSYFYRNKLEKAEYVRFLKTLVQYAGENIGQIPVSVIADIDEDINMIQNNNVNGRYVVDKYIMQL